MSCDAATLGVIQAVYYDVDGGAVDSLVQSDNEVKLLDVAPGSVGEAILNESCWHWAQSRAATSQNPKGDINSQKKPRP